MTMNWYEYTRGPKLTGSETMYASLDKRGNILLNRKAFEAMNEPKAVVLLYERRRGIIGLRPANPDLEQAFPVMSKATHSHRTIRANPFCRDLDLLPTKLIRFHPTAIDDKGILRLTLPERI